MTRLLQLKKRYDKIIELNSIHSYSTTLVPEKKTAQYLSMLLRIKQERWELIRTTTNAEEIKQGFANLVLTNKTKV